MTERRNGGKGLELALAALVLVFTILILDGVRAQDAQPEPIRCEGGYCLIREQQLIHISQTLAAMRAQLEEYAKLCRWGTR